MSVLAISFSKHIVSPLEILQEGKEISSSNWDLCSPKQLWEHLWELVVQSCCCCSTAQQYCLTSQAISVAQGPCGRGLTLVLSHVLWTGSLGAPRTLGNLQHSSKPLPCLVSVNPKQPGQAGLLGHLAPRIPKPGRAQGCPANAWTLGCLLRSSVWDSLSSGGAAPAAKWGNVGQGLQRSARKEKGEKEDWAGTPLEQQSGKAGSHGVKSSAFTPRGVGRAAMKPMWQRLGDSKGQVTAKGKNLTFAFPKQFLITAWHSQDLLMPGETVSLFRAPW